MKNSPALPSPALLAQQADWLAAARSQLLRQAGIARRQRVLDLGAGYGAVTGELARRAGGPVTALDCATAALRTGFFGNAARVCGDARQLPFKTASFELVFSQFTLLWIAPPASALSEIRRVLAPDGVFIALEPDYGGMIEYPPDIATREVWLAALERAGADPYVGRKLPDLLEQAGFAVKVGLLNALEPPAPERFDFLLGLALTETEKGLLHTMRQTVSPQQWKHIAHLPCMLITAHRR